MCDHIDHMHTRIYMPAFEHVCCVCLPCLIPSVDSSQSRYWGQGVKCLNRKPASHLCVCVHMQPLAPECEWSFAMLWLLKEGMSEPYFSSFSQFAWVCVCVWQERVLVCTHALACKETDIQYVFLCVVYLISVSEQMLMSTPTKLTHSCTTLSSATFRAPTDTSC